MLLQPKPPGFKEHVYTFSFEVPSTEEKVWKWLNDMGTFTDNQIWPYRVEFYSPDEEKIPNGFHEGVLTNHHGPFINFAGVLTKIQSNYRELQYNYGTYAISFRWVRPFKLEFSTNEVDGKTTITGTLSSWVKPGFYSLWHSGQSWFWGSFKRWATRSLKKM